MYSSIRRCIVVVVHFHFILLPRLPSSINNSLFLQHFPSQNCKSSNNYLGLGSVPLPAALPSAATIFKCSSWS